MPDRPTKAQSHRAQLAGLTVIRLKAMATLQFQMAAALVGKGQDELRKHFSDSAELMIEAAARIRERSDA